MANADDIVLGRVQQSGREVDLTVPLPRLLRHGMVCGGTGLGKSMMLASILLQAITQAPDLRIVLLDQKGETFRFLIEVALPALCQDYPHLRPERVLTVDPFSPTFAVGLDPLVPLPGVESAEQAWVITTLLCELFDDMGERMRAIAQGVLSGVIAARGTLIDVARCLTSPDYAVAVASRVADPEAATYLRATLHGPLESRTSVSALRSRLDYLLRTRDLRALLCSGHCVGEGELLRGPLTCVTTGRPPMGDMRLGSFLSQLVFSRLTAGIFARTEADAARPVLVVADEFQELVRAGGAENVGRILELARSRGVFIWAAFQSMSQLAEQSPALVRSLQTNCDWDFRFRPDASELRHIEGLLPITGRRTDPARPDRLLSEADERRALAGRLSRMPARYTLTSDRRAGTAVIMRTLSVPTAQLEKRAAATSEQVRTGFLRGRLGLPRAALRAREPLFDLTPAPALATGRGNRVSGGDLAAASPDTSAPAAPARPSRRPPRPRPILELP